jgi:hypothetical protein
MFTRTYINAILLYKKQEGPEPSKQQEEENLTLFKGSIPIENLLGARRVCLVFTIKDIENLKYLNWIIHATITMTNQHL